MTSSSRIVKNHPSRDDLLGNLLMPIILLPFLGKYSMAYCRSKTFANRPFRVGRFIIYLRESAFKVSNSVMMLEVVV